MEQGEIALLVQGKLQACGTRRIFSSVGTKMNIAVGARRPVVQGEKALLVQGKLLACGTRRISSVGTRRNIAVGAKRTFL